MKSGGTAKHVDGMSSDDEMTELEATAFRNQRGIVRFRGTKGCTNTLLLCLMI
jgi:hypothetical protein